MLRRDMLGPEPTRTVCIIGKDQCGGQKGTALFRDIGSRLPGCALMDEQHEAGDEQKTTISGYHRKVHRVKTTLAACILSCREKLRKGLESQYDCI